MISLATANFLYVWGARISITAAVVTAIAGIASYIGTRVRDRQFDSEIAHLNYKAAEFEKEAAEARLEQEKLKSKLAWRRLSEFQVKTIVENLKGNQIKLILFIRGVDPETTQYALDFESALKTANIQYERKVGIVQGGAHYGVYVAAPDETEEFHILVQALQLAEVKIQAVKDENLQIIICPKEPA